jgi:uncharacterized membrane-anchored protein
MRKRIALVAGVQLACVLVAVAPQVSARATGDEYRLEVAPVDPIDPFRGAYVTLDYPGIRVADEPGNGAVYVKLVRDGELWRSSGTSRTRPEEGPYLACDDRGWEVRCGIESWFAPQDEAARMDRTLADRGAIATVRIDARGNAALVDLQPK